MSCALEESFVRLPQTAQGGEFALLTSCRLSMLVSPFNASFSGLNFSVGEERSSVVLFEVFARPLSNWDGLCHLIAVLQMLFISLFTVHIPFYCLIMILFNTCSGTFGCNYESKSATT